MKLEILDWKFDDVVSVDEENAEKQNVEISTETVLKAVGKVYVRCAVDLNKEAKEKLKQKIQNIVKVGVLLNGKDFVTNDNLAEKLKFLNKFLPEEEKAVVFWTQKADEHKYRKTVKKSGSKTDVIVIKKERCANKTIVVENELIK